jgi:aspartyl-tRNA(Asn)/glutamyl-tRNA(Gln) amidotransferase subunit B
MALSEALRKKYTPSIGIECHVQLKTKTKLFSAVGNDAREAAPNTLISHIDVGMPGALPVLNEGAIELACLAAFALNTEPQKHSYFERKHYFYPDLPMGYQISQLHGPIIVGGYVEIEVDGKKKKINLNRAQLEADAGKNTHPDGADYSLVDLNRVGTPLLEIVSEPEIHSAAEAKAYAHELYLLMKYAGVSDVDLYHGNMRFDVNVSVSKDPNKFGNRTETKNLNSFRSVENAALYEIDRQIELLEKGQEIVQETRGWDEAKQKTTTQRTKEEAQDYRYMPEPDIPPVELDHGYIGTIKDSMPILPRHYRNEFSKMELDAAVVEQIINDPGFAQMVNRIFERSGAEHARRIAFWLIQPIVNEEEFAGFESKEYKSHFPDDSYFKLSEMVEANKLSSTAAKEIFAELLKKGGDPEKIAEEKDLIQVSNEGEIEKIVAEVLAENSQAAEDVKKGEMKAIGFLVGQVMKKSRGKANPQMAQDLIKKQLGI